MTAPNLADSDRAQLVHLAMKTIARTGEATTRAALAKEARMPRARIDTIFATDDALFDAILEEWYAPDIAIMEEVIASDLPIRRKFYEFFARRFLREQERYRKDPATFAVYCEIGTDKFENVRGYIDLADHYLCELIAEAQAEGYLKGLEVDTAMSIINQMVSCYLQPYLIAVVDDRLSEEKLGLIVGAIFDGLDSRDGGARGTQDIRAA